MTLFSPKIDLEKVNRLGLGSLAQTLGMRITEIGDDFLAGTLPVDERTRQPFGLLHGGASVALAETLGSVAGNLCLAPGSGRAVGLEINANHLRAVRAGPVTGIARPLKLGRSTQVWEIRIHDPEQRLCCISRLTLAVVPESALGG